jgi:hypothetical protein
MTPPTRLLAPTLLRGGGAAEETLDLTVLPLLDHGSHIDARPELLPEAGARDERALLAVSSRLLLGGFVMATLSGLTLASPRKRACS